jgi:hypothetical protein
MKVFTIYTKGEKEKEVIAISDQIFDWYAFIFGPLWFVYNRMWMTAVLSVVLIVACSYLCELFFGSSQYVTNAFMIVYGFFAYDLMEYKLVKSGYALCDVVIAKTEEEAELEYLRKK